MSTLLVCTESSLPPNTGGSIRGYLEIEIVKITLLPVPVTLTSQPSSATPAVTTLPLSTHSSAKIFLKKKQKENRGGDISDNTNTKPTTPTSTNTNQSESKSTSPIGSAGSTAKYIWSGETPESASSVKVLGAIGAVGATSSGLKCGKVRYSIETGLKNFHEYLLSSAPLKIRITSNKSDVLIGQAEVRIPSGFLKQFAVKAEKRINFEETTKTFQLLDDKNSARTGELKLKFKMIFVGKKSLGNKTETATGEQAITPDTDTSASIDYSSVQIETSVMKYLDRINTAEDFVEKCYSPTNVHSESSSRKKPSTSKISRIIDDLVTSRFRLKQCTVYDRVSSITVLLETLILQPQESFLSVRKPQFTVNGRITKNLLDNIHPTRDYDVMHFKSIAFNDMEQRADFNLEVTRDIHIDFNNNAVIEYGNVTFTVFWREDGADFSQFLGTGFFKLSSLFNASLLEQRKRMPIISCECGQYVGDLICKVSLNLKEDSQFEIGLLEELAIEEILRKEAAAKIASDETDQKETNKIDNDNSASVSTSDTMTPTAQLLARSLSSSSTASKSMPWYSKKVLLAMKIPEETNKIRVLKGFINITESRNLTELKAGMYFLVCRRFWTDTAAAFNFYARKGDHQLPNFNYQEDFRVLNGEKFTKRMEKNYLEVQLWCKGAAPEMEHIGSLKLPLHQYFIAYRDAAITNRLCTEKLPVISIDGWSPILVANQNKLFGEIKCLLAIGTDEQIVNLKKSHSIDETVASKPLISDRRKNQASTLEILNNLIRPLQNNDLNNILTDAKDNFQLKKSKRKATSKPPPPGCNERNLKSFKILLDIESAINLPHYPLPSKWKKSLKRISYASVSASVNGLRENSSQQRVIKMTEEPSTYVTFQAENCNSTAMKSYEGMVYATHVCEKQSEPRWAQQFTVTVASDYLTINQKRFILKVWKKASSDLPRCQNLPNPMEDSIIGFCSVNLSAFLTERMPRIAGWFNIVDYNGRVNGLLQIKCEPIDDVNELEVWQQQKSLTNSTASPDAIKSSLLPTLSNLKQSMSKMVAPKPESSISPAPPADAMDTFIDNFEAKLELTHLNLGHAIKRKFTELEGISQRLRTKLLDVTGDKEFPPGFDINSWSNLEPIDIGREDDLQLEEFEKDLNTVVDTSSDSMEKWLGGDGTDDEKVKLITTFLEQTGIDHHSNEISGNTNFGCARK